MIKERTRITTKCRRNSEKMKEHELVRTYPCGLVGWWWRYAYAPLVLLYSLYTTHACCPTALCAYACKYNQTRWYSSWTLWHSGCGSLLFWNMCMYLMVWIGIENDNIYYGTIYIMVQNQLKIYFNWNSTLGSGFKTITAMAENV